MNKGGEAGEMYLRDRFCYPAVSRQLVAAGKRGLLEIGSVNSISNNRLKG